MSENQTMIRAQGLSKFYGRFTAVKDLSFSIGRGQIVAFLGPNGAGKSTTMKLLTGYLAPSEGTAEICGHDIVHDRLAVANKIGYLPENGPLYADMTPLALLRFFGEARGLDRARSHERIEELVELIELKDVLHKPIGKLSRGYKQRVGMAQCMLHEPQVLIMDEPTAGLDPNQIRGVRHTIRKLGQDRTILLSTHILQEVEEMADRILLIHEGRLRFDGTLEELKKGKSLYEQFEKMTGTAA